MPLACLMRMSLVLQGGSSGLFAAELGRIACPVLTASAVACSRQEPALYQHVAARLRGVTMCSVAHVQCPSASAEPSHLAQRLAVGQRKPRLHRAPLTTRLRARLAVQLQRAIVGAATTTKPVEL